MRYALAVLALLLAASARAAPLPSAAALSREIDATGAKAVVDRLAETTPDTKGETEWDRLIDRIWDGDETYIALAPRLRPGADAAAAESLPIGLAHALTVAPAAVLRTLPANGGLKETLGVCTIPFIEDTVKDIPAYVHDTEAALGRVTAPDLQSIKSACLVNLRKAAKTIANYRLTHAR